MVAGVPLVAVPQAVDQPTNAKKVESPGVKVKRGIKWLWVTNAVSIFYVIPYNI